MRLSLLESIDAGGSVSSLALGAAWLASTSVAPLLRVPTRAGARRAARAHASDRVGVPARLGADVVPIDVRVAVKTGPTQRQPA